MCNAAVSAFRKVQAVICLAAGAGACAWMIRDLLPDQPASGIGFGVVAKRRYVSGYAKVAPVGLSAQLPCRARRDGTDAATC